LDTLEIVDTLNTLEIVDTLNTCHQGGERKKGSDEFHGRCLLNRTKGSVQSACELGRKRDCGKKRLLLRKEVPANLFRLVDVRSIRTISSESKKNTSATTGLQKDTYCCAVGLSSTYKALGFFFWRGYTIEYA
jgi:hypothetical protein